MLLSQKLTGSIVCPPHQTYPAVVGRSADDMVIGRSRKQGKLSPATDRFPLLSRLYIGNSLWETLQSLLQLNGLYYATNPLGLRLPEGSEGFNGAY
jgi:hypothetical protein